MKYFPVVTFKSILTSILLALLSSSALAGGLVELQGIFNASSNNITNPWWPQAPGSSRTFFAEKDGDCEIVFVDVLNTLKVVDGVSVREVRDQTYIDEECDGLDLFLAEDTFDWYARDVNGNVWYFGEYTVSYDWEECDNPDGFGGCLDGGWEAGEDVGNTGMLAKEGIILLDDPHKGDFYFQEYYEDVATDMGKVLNFKDVDTLLYGKQKDCLKIKEWLPLDPGSIEHKYYCYGIGLVLVAELTGGKTLWVELISQTQ